MAFLIPVTQVDGWAEARLLRTSGFVATTTDLLSQAAFQTELADEIVVQISAAASRLPPGIDRTLTRSRLVRASVTHAVPRLLSSQAFRTVWRTAAGALHRRVLTVLRDRNSVVKINGGALTVDIPVAVSSLLAAAGLPSAFARDLPQQLPLTVTVFDSQQLRQARIAVHIAEDSRPYLAAVVVALALAGVAAARRRIRAFQLGLVAGALTTTVAWFLVDVRATPTGRTPVATAAAKAFISPLEERLVLTAAILVALAGAIALLKLTRRIARTGETPK